MIKIDYDRQRDGQSVYENYVGALQSADTSKIVWFSPTGNDTTGAGTVANPYQTRAKANSETSSSKPYALLIEDFYISGYSSSNIVYLNTATGNDSNNGSTELLAKLTYGSAATAASTTKKIRVVNDGAELAVDITKPTEVKAGVTASIVSDLTDQFDNYTASSTTWASGFISVLTDCLFLSKILAVNNTGSSDLVWSSSDGATWASVDTTISEQIQAIVVNEETRKIYVFGTTKIAVSSDNVAYTLIDATFTSTAQAYAYYNANIVPTRYDLYVGVGQWSPYYNKFINVIDNIIQTSTDGVNWQFLTDAPTPELNTNSMAVVVSDREYVLVISEISGSAPYYSIAITDDLESWTNVSQSVTDPDGGSSNFGYAGWISEFGAFIIGNYTPPESSVVSSEFLVYGDGTYDTFSAATNRTQTRLWSNVLGKYIVNGSDGSESPDTIYRSDPFAIDISADVAGFTISGATYSGTVEMTNCTVSNPVTTAALSTIRCHATDTMRISNNAQSHENLLVNRDLYITCTPANSNALVLQSVTLDNGGLYIFNASSTGYEQIKDIISEKGVHANYSVVVSSGNVRGTSNNAVLGSSVGNSNPILDDDGRPNRPWIPNGSGTESPVIAVAKYSTNSDGVKNDLGCFIVNDEEVGYTYKKSKYLPSGSLKIGKGIESSEQVGDDGEVDVFGNPERAVEVVLINYESLSPEDTAFVDELDELNDYHVRLNLYPSTQIVTGSVTVNGNQSSGAFTLAVDATAIHPGATLTIGGVEYYILYASPNYTAATTLVLNKPLESNVLDNDVITTSYPAGYGEYSYSPKSRELQLSVAQSPSAYFINVALRFIRKWQS